MQRKAKKVNKTFLENIFNKINPLLLNVFIWILAALNMIFIASILIHRWRTVSEKNDQYKTHVEIETFETIEHVEIEVLNGCGVDKLAKRMTDFLRENKKFDVVNFDNYGWYDIPGTLIIDRKSMSMNKARKVARFLGVSDSHIIPQLSPARNSDVSVIIGSDYQKLKVFK